jgi:lysozyme family protein
VKQLWAVLRTSSLFQQCIPFTLEWEITRNAQGDVICEHDPNDPGGATKYGIDQRDHPDVDVCALTQPAAERIYYLKEWTKLSCEQMPYIWAQTVFDSGVNPGMGFTARHLQICVGARADGLIGPKTIQAIKEAPFGVLWQLLNHREGYYRTRSPRLTKVYLEGWLNRVNALRKFVQQHVRPS